MTTVDTSLAAPLRGAGFGQAFTRFWSKYATFHGRASRSEFWWAALFVQGPGLVLSLSIRAAEALLWPDLLWSLATFIPMLAVSWRRLHDANRSGANWFWVLLPVVGWIILLVQLVAEPVPAGERWDG